MAGRHIRNMNHELAESEFQTEFRFQDFPSHQRRHYDVNMFRDGTNLDFASVEPPPRTFNSQCSGKYAVQSQESPARNWNDVPYQSPFFTSAGVQSQPAIYQMQQPKEPPRPPSRLTLGPGYPGIRRCVPGSSSVFTGGSRVTQSGNQPSSFYDPFKYHPEISEPKTPVRMPPKQLQISSSSDEFDPISSPSVMPPPFRRGSQNLGNTKVTPPSPYAPTPRTNRLEALLSKTRRPQRPSSAEDDEADNLVSAAVLHADSSPKTFSLSHAPMMTQGIPLVPISILPAKYRSVFPYTVFNATQSKCFNAVYNTSDNIILSSPTGSGKTAVMELAVCRLMETFEPGTFKIIYQAPTKALCAERKRDWEKKFMALGLKCTELTGDTQFNQLAEVKNGDLIVTTPEKWDSVTRRWTDHKKLLGLVRLFLIDEVHILKEDRGATLEVVVSRMKTIGSRVRFVALSATVPNSKDIATWLGKDCDNPNIPAHEERLGEEFRPVKLEKVVYGYQANANNFVFDKFLDQKLYDVIHKHGNRKPVMVFCATRNICVSTAKILAEKWSGPGRYKAWPAPLTSFSFRDKDLQVTGRSGVAIHHAGIDATDRTLIEKLFLEGHISVICCTSTLAVGVNLPAHLVIIKNTVSWQGCQMRQYLDLEVMQMLGRAGRPQFDTTGVAIIMTRKENKEHYERMISGTEKLESCLHLNLIEHLNAEIGLGTITDIESAKQWLRSTFLYIRMKSNPAFYNFKAENLETELENLIERDIASLDAAGFVEYEHTKLKCLEPGDAMTRYYIRFETMKNIMALKESAKCSEILACIAEADEFKEVRIRSGEKAVLKEINSSPSMKWPVKVDISSPAQKANILIQFEIGCMEFPTTEGLQKYRATLLQDKSLIFQHLHRLVRCVCDIKLFVRDAISCRNALELARCIEAKVWENSPSMLLQLDGLGMVGVRRFVNNDIKTIEQLDALEAHKIEMIASRNPPYGAKMKQDIAGIPRFRIYTQVTKVQANRRDPVKVDFRAEIGVLNDQTPGKWHGKLLYLYFLAERSDGYLIDFRRMPILKLSSNKDVIVHAELTEPGQRITCYIGCEEIVNTAKSVDVEVQIQKSQFPPTRKEGLMSAFLRKGANARQEQEQDPVDYMDSQMSIVNKPFKPPSRENSKVSKDNGDEFDDAEFENDLRELGTIGEDLIIDRPSISVPPLTWTPINLPRASQVEDNISTQPGANLSHEDAFAEDINEPTQRPDGKWECNHRCSDKRSCRHLCCREGLEHKPKLKKKAQPKPNSKKLDPVQTVLTARVVDGTNKPKAFQKQDAKEPLHTKPAHTPLRKRVSDLISAAKNSAVEIIDLSNEEEQEPVFKGNGARSVRTLNQLHAKCQTNKTIKLPKLSKLKTIYKAGDKAHVPAKSTLNDDIEDVFSDDDDFPTVSEIMEDSRMEKENKKNRKEKEESYGLNDSLLDSLDHYVVENPNKHKEIEEEISIYDFPENIPRKTSMKDKGGSLESGETNVIVNEQKTGENPTLEIRKETVVEGNSSEMLPSSPPQKRHLTEIPAPPQLAKRVRFDDTVIKHLLVQPSSSDGVNSLSSIDKMIPTDLTATPDTSVCSHSKVDEDKENCFERELMDFLGDCVVFID
ncbi:hypothetical protein H072_3266 [Dactylellina haptotyla CBS 200.50]|uniref:DNA 3'-5' helicase n=1 Tax=Dactylellina haptotyla (strain CBS 200.50) TaxID=1284197 RepID=S8C4U9_DACHA|nr:hypothetical protein H072_3266 [Dactylellina haptotyla CBS 200.50]